jgi:O-antigen/teichoic acid export membrane protein
VNQDSRISNSIKNISFGLLAQVVQMLFGFVTRTIFIKYLSVEYLGVNGLFTNILALLSLTEMGISSVLLYSLYKSLAEKEERKIASVINFFKEIYYKIATIVAVIGLFLLFFLHDIVQNPSVPLARDLNIIYLLFLFNTVSSYFFYHKISLFNADQNGYIISICNALVFVVQNVIQIFLLVVFKNFILYLIVQSIFQLSGNLIISLLVNKYYPFLKKYKKEKVDENTKKNIFSNVKSTALVKIGGLLVNSTDNLILNYFSGLAMVGLLSNYNLLIGLASGLIVQVFSSLTGSIANVNVTENIEKRSFIFNSINFANFWLYGFFSIGILVLINDFITIWIGTKFILSFPVVVALTVNFYMYGMQNAVWTYKSTFGFFKQGQYLVILTAIINLCLSFLLGKELGLLGILIATALARLITNAWYDPYIVLKLGLNKNPTEYLKKYFLYLIILTTSFLVISFIANYLPFNLRVNFGCKLILCLIIPNLFIYYYFKSSQELRYFKSVLYLIIFKKK